MTTSMMNTSFAHVFSPLWHDPTQSRNLNEETDGNLSGNSTHMNFTMDTGFEISRAPYVYGTAGFGGLLQQIPQTRECCSAEKSSPSFHSNSPSQ